MRKFLMSTMLAGTVALGGCSTTQITEFLGQVQADTAAACAFVPTVSTILAVAAALGFAPASIAGAAIQTVANAICSKVPPPASARYRALSPRGIGPANTVGIIGNAPVSGWRTQ